MSEEKGGEQQLRAEFKKLVIMGNHPECETYDEALEKELGDGCMYMLNEKNSYVRYIPNEHDFNVDEWKKKLEFFSGLKIHFIGQPITIGRVLFALSNCNLGFNPAYSIVPNILRKSDSVGTPAIYFSNEKIKGVRNGFTYWILQTSEGKEATDDDQSIQSIKTLLEVLR